MGKTFLEIVRENKTVEVDPHAKMFSGYMMTRDERPETYLIADNLLTSIPNLSRPEALQSMRSFVLNEDLGLTVSERRQLAALIAVANLVNRRYGLTFTSMPNSASLVIDLKAKSDPNDRYGKLYELSQELAQYIANRPLNEPLLYLGLTTGPMNLLYKKEMLEANQATTAALIERFESPDSGSHTFAFSFIPAPEAHSPLPGENFGSLNSYATRAILFGLRTFRQDLAADSLVYGKHAAMVSLEPSKFISYSSADEAGLLLAQVLGMAFPNANIPNVDHLSSDQQSALEG